MAIHSDKGKINSGKRINRTQPAVPNEAVLIRQ